MASIILILYTIIDNMEKITMNCYKCKLCPKDFDSTSNLMTIYDHLKTHKEITN